LAPEEIALVVAAAEELMQPVVVVQDDDESVPAWRFSGRWFASGRYSSLRRPHH
jgi:hypothetical protein